MNMTLEKLKIANELQRFAIERAEALLKANGTICLTSVDSVEFEDDQIIVNFSENLRSMRGDSYSITLDSSMLEMDDDQWNGFILSKTLETQELKRKTHDRAEKAKREANQAEFDRLKKELEL